MHIGGMTYTFDCSVFVCPDAKCPEFSGGRGGHTVVPNIHGPPPTVAWATNRSRQRHQTALHSGYGRRRRDAQAVRGSRCVVWDKEKMGGYSSTPRKGKTSEEEGDESLFYAASGMQVSSTL